MRLENSSFVFGQVHKGHGLVITGQVIRYLIASAISAVLSLSLPIVLHEGLDVPEEVAVAIALGTVFILNFFTLRIYVFRSAATVVSQLVKFAVASLAFRNGEYLFFLVLFQALGLHYMVALFVALGTSFMAKFFVQRLVIFTRRSS